MNSPTKGCRRPFAPVDFFQEGSDERLLLVPTAELSRQLSMSESWRLDAHESRSESPALSSRPTYPLRTRHTPSNLKCHTPLALPGASAL